MLEQWLNMKIEITSYDIAKYQVYTELHVHTSVRANTLPCALARKIGSMQESLLHEFLHESSVRLANALW